ncbi:hypothetical protein ACAG96_01935 [Candidatus Izemoplasma sp. B36]|uniref:hypothetical protein n=1 Tax=Candidatus Izemoplasma sp. B36 TaxID=3242468 RepID=UPI0035586E0A
MANGIGIEKSILMENKNLTNTIDYYCKNEFINFKKSEIYKEILLLAKNKKYHINLEIGKLEKLKKTKWYISLSVLNLNNQIVEIPDDGFLSYSTELVTMDNQNRVNFSSWIENDFIETLKWIKTNLNQK